jgi:hypothetical protein
MFMSNRRGPGTRPPDALWVDNVDHHPAAPRDGIARCIFNFEAMPCLADSDMGAARRFVRGMAELCGVTDLCGQAPAELAALVRRTC